MGRVAEPRVYKRKDSPHYLLSFYDEEGNRIRRTSRATSRKEALVELNQEIARAAVPAPTSLPIASGFKLFLDTRPLKRSSRGRYETTLRHWVAFFQENSIADFGQIRKRTLSAFIAWRRQEGVLDPTIRRDLAFLSAVWNFSGDHPEWDEDMPPCPVTRGLLKNVRPSRKRVRYASAAEWQALMGATNQPYQRHILTVAV